MLVRPSSYRLRGEESGKRVLRVGISMLCLAITGVFLASNQASPNHAAAVALSQETHGPFPKVGDYGSTPRVDADLVDSLEDPQGSEVTRHTIMVLSLAGQR